MGAEGIIDFGELEEGIDEIIKTNPTNKERKIREMVCDFKIGIAIIRRQIKLRERNIIQKKKGRMLKFDDLPKWENKTRCPICNAKLTKKWEGLVCQNQCPMKFKLGRGWVYLQRDSGWSNARMAINSIMGSNERNKLQWRFAKKKKSILIRDDYKCRNCNYGRSMDFFYDEEKQLEVHHIIPASEEMALYLDETNLITLCKKCHKKIHTGDKYKFGGLE